MSVLASISEVDAADMNLLLRAIGVAMLKDSEKETAEQILEVLSSRAIPVKKAFGTFFPGDFAAAMTVDKMTDEQYKNARNLLLSFRLIFHKDVLKAEAVKFKEDYPTLPFDSWDAAVKFQSSQE